MKNDSMRDAPVAHEPAMRDDLGDPWKPKFCRASAFDARYRRRA